MTDTKKPRKPLKRTELRRKTPMKRAKAKPSSGTRTGMMRRKSKPLPKVNPERQKKAAKRGAAKHRAYMASEARRAVEARSEGRCEFLIRPDAWSLTQFFPFRCAQRATEHHHLTYARYGGGELPEDVQHLCKEHHHYLESLKPAGNRRSRAARSQGGDSR